MTIMPSNGSCSRQIFRQGFPLFLKKIKRASVKQERKEASNKTDRKKEKKKEKKRNFRFFFGRLGYEKEFCLIAPSFLAISSYPARKTVA